MLLCLLEESTLRKILSFNNDNQKLLKLLTMPSNYCSGLNYNVPLETIQYPR